MFPSHCSVPIIRHLAGGEGASLLFTLFPLRLIFLLSFGHIYVSACFISDFIPIHNPMLAALAPLATSNGSLCLALSQGKVAELRQELSSGGKKDKNYSAKKIALKKIVANMTMSNNDMVALFPDVIGCMNLPSLEIKKMYVDRVPCLTRVQRLILFLSCRCFLFLVNYSRMKPDVALQALPTLVNVRRIFFLFWKTLIYDRIWKILTLWFAPLLYEPFRIFTFASLLKQLFNPSNA